MTSPVECLPVEVFDIIASGLDTPAYQQLRLTSRQLHLLTLSTFAKRCFSELTTTLGSPSLDRLVRVSKHGYFCKAVTFLDIKLLNHRDYMLLTNIHKVGIYPPPKRFSSVPGVKQEHISSEATLYDDVLGPQYPQCITARLTRALEGFPNLKRIRFRARYNDPNVWRSIAMPEGDQVFRTKCFQAVFDAILKSEIQLEDFSTAKQKRSTILSKSASLAYPALQFPFSTMPSLQHCFARLQSLKLAIVAAHNGDSRIPGWENGLSQFLACAPDLRSLTLSLDRTRHVSHYSAAIIRSLALSCRLEALESFHLLNCSLHESDLIKYLITHAKSLTCISLSTMQLLTWNWETFWTSLQGLGALRRVHVACLEGVRGLVTFRCGNSLKSKLVLDPQKAESSMGEMLEDLAAAVRGEGSWVPDAFGGSL
ncbi:hypothetical protein CC86DRAFT_48362 [Ophiobolus disseminans]|uniref:F-box domain-containing protein n=1 Tax=Ophiobolus disseminans TaxID=1469910 RepID=A0A6A6ZX32_9PLEO|nr:hypothetical protein CC86DRAFT_48362 [Ophiobolus disseminans]